MQHSKLTTLVGRPVLLGDLQVADRKANCQSSEKVDRHETAVWHHRAVNRPGALQEHTCTCTSSSSRLINWFVWILNDSGINTLRTGLLNCLNARSRGLIQIEVRFL